MKRKLMKGKPAERPKRIVAVAGKYPNYIFHLLALARIRYDSDYADKYRNSVPPDDIAFLKSIENALSVGMRSGGELTFVIGFPTYFALESREELEEFFSLINVAIGTDDFNSFFQKYKGHIERLNLWIGLEKEDLSELKTHGANIARLGRVILRNYDYHETRVWPIEKERIAPVAAGIEAHFDKVDIISKWEKLTGLEYKLDNFNAVLCTAMKNGPDANSIGYDCVVFYCGRPLDELTQLISHEIGTHLLFDEYKSLLSLGMFDVETLYYAYENLARYYNSLILEDEILKYDLSAFHDRKFNEIFVGLFGAYPDMPVRDLMHRAARTFKEENP